jgi:glutamate carboxypeptidase
MVLSGAAAAVGTGDAPGGLSPLETRLVERVEAGREGAIDLLRRAVDLPSATENHAGVRAVGDLFAAELAALGFETRWLQLPPEVGRAGHLIAERRGDRGKRLLLLGHLDTVLEGEPFRRDGDRAYGTGTSDMKGGDVVLVEALRALHEEGALEHRSIVVILTGDEEDAGVPAAVSRRPLVEAAARCDAALSFESAARGAAVVGRRGIASWRLEVRAATGHSSTIFREERGFGAIFEAARVLDAFRERLPEPYLTFNPSVVVGGTEAALDPENASGNATGKHNVVPAAVIVEGDLRFLSLEQRARAEAAMREIAGASLPGTSASISFSDGMPPMAPTDGNRALLAVLDRVSRDLGTGPVGEHDPTERGAGDISFVAHTIDSLDGLGTLGEQEHAPGEYLLLDELTPAIAKAALLILRLTS